MVWAGDLDRRDFTWDQPVDTRDSEAQVLIAGRCPTADRSAGAARYEGAVLDAPSAH